MRPHPKNGKNWRKNGRPGRYAEAAHRARRREVREVMTYGVQARPLPLVQFGSDWDLVPGWVRVPSSIPGTLIYKHTP